MKLHTQIVDLPLSGGDVLATARDHLDSVERDHALLRWGAIAAAQGSLRLELSLMSGAQGGGTPVASGDAAPAPGSAAAMVVPTGVGARVGGFIGDAAPVAQVIAGVVDELIVHPNVVNAADFLGGGTRATYTDGYTLDRFLRGQLGLAPAKGRRVGVLIDRLSDADTVRILNSINAVRAVHGVEISGYARCGEKLQSAIERSGHGHFIGRVANPQVLMDGADGLVRAGSEAIAVVSSISGVTSAMIADHYRKGAPNPIGSTEALISRAVTWYTGLPCAHAPAFGDCVGETDTVVAPRAAAEPASGTGLPCVLLGLSQAPRACTRGGLGVRDLEAIIVPASCAGGAPALASQEFGTKLIAVRGNSSAVGVDVDQLALPDALTVRSYAEAVGALVARRVGVAWVHLAGELPDLREIS